MDVEPLRLEAGESVGDGLELLADRLKVIQALLESEVLEIIGAELVPQECGELLVLLQEGMLEVGAIDVMAMLDRSMTAASLPEILRCSRCPKTSEILLAVSRQSPSSELRSKGLWIGKCLLKMKLRQYSICEIE